MSNNLHWGLVISTGKLSPPFHGTFKIFDSILALRIKNLQRCQAMNSMATILYCGLQRNRNEWTFCKCHTEAHPKTGESILGPSRFNSWFHCHVVLDQFVHKGTDLILALEIKKLRDSHGFFCICSLLHDLGSTFLHY